MRDERKRIDDGAALALRPALATVLTPAQLAKAGLSDRPARAGDHER